VIINNKSECTYLDEWRNTDFHKRIQESFEESAKKYGLTLSKFKSIPPWDFTLGDEQTVFVKCKPVKVRIDQKGGKPLLRVFLLIFPGAFRSLRTVVVSEALSARPSLATKIPFLAASWSQSESDGVEWVSFLFV
jgi:hypothetical protein